MFRLRGAWRAGVAVALVFFIAACGKKEAAPAPSTAQAPASQTSPKRVEQGMAPPEGVSAAAEGDPATLTLPLGFKRRTGDLQQMLKDGNIRALVMINPISFFYQNGQPHGVTYEALD